MIIAKNDEAKRSKIWRIVTSVSFVLIIIIAIFLLTKLFTTNPLEGDWASDDGNLNMSIKSNGKMSVTISEVADVSDVTVNMNYTMDKEEKTIIITADESELKDMAEKSDGQYTEDALENALDSIVDTFDYSVDQGQLTLTEREYGDQLIFIQE